MTPVINPWIFYIMPVCENFSFVAMALSVIGLATLFVFAMWFSFDSSYAKEETVKRMREITKKVIILTVICVLIACFIPSEETLTKMLIAQNVTYERVDVVTDTVANVYNDIMNLFQDSGAANG